MMMHGMGHGPMFHRSADVKDTDVLGKAYDPHVMRQLLRYLGPYKRHLAVSLSTMVLYSLTSLATPFLIKEAIDRFITTGDLPGLNLIALIFLGNALINWASQYWQTVTMAQMGQGILYTLREQLFAHLQKLSLSFFDRRQAGQIWSRVMNDVGQLQELITSGVVTTTSDLLTLSGIVIVMLGMNLRLALLTFVVLPLMFLLMRQWQRYSLEAFRRVRRAISAVNAGLQENISGVRVIQSLSREEVNARRFDDLNEAHLDANLRAGRLSALMLPMVDLLTALATALVVVYGGFLVFQESLTAGALVAFTLYIQRFFDPIRDISMRYAQMQMAMASGERIFDLLDVEPAIKDAPQAVTLPKIQGAILFERVGFWYEPGLPVLEEIDLAVEPGETIAIVGPTGAGKSTFVSLIPRLYDVKSGRITIDHHDIREVTLSSLRSQVGMVLQDPFLFSGTIRENILYGRLDASEEEMVHAAEAVGAHEFIERLERSYDTEVRERGNNFSVGQRQLISFARALLADPRILILDEATASVDTQTELLIQQALRELLRGRTSFVIAHRLSTIRDADRIIVLDKGRIVETGSHEELLARRGLYYNLYTMNYAAILTEGEAAAAR